MPKWSKILLILLTTLLVLAAIAKLVLNQTLLKTSYVNEPTLQGELIEDSLELNGHTRYFLWFKPSKMRDSSHQILYVLHGSTSNGKDIRKQMAYEFDELGGEKGFVVVYPTGYFNHWNDCRASADYQSNVENTDDITFLKQIEQHIEAKLQVDFEKRFATGLSNGGHFCYKLALEVPDWITAIAPIAANMPIDENLDCSKKGRFVPLFVLNGTADKINPYEGGLVSVMGNDSRGMVLSTDETLQYWTSLTNCTIEVRKNRLPDIVENEGSKIEESRYLCNGELKAMLYKIEGGGHTIPHPESNALPTILGVTNRDVNAPKMIWAFFEGI